MVRASNGSDNGASPDYSGGPKPTAYGRVAPGAVLPPDPPSTTGQRSQVTPPAYAPPGTYAPQGGQSTRSQPKSPRGTRTKKVRDRKTFGLTKSPKRHREPKPKTYKPDHKGIMSHVAVWAIVIGIGLSFFWAFANRIPALNAQIKSQTAQNSLFKARLDQLAANSFPIDDAKNQALRLAVECFTTQNRDAAGQQVRLQAVGVKSGDCGWNGSGTTSVYGAPVYDSSQSVIDYANKRAMIVIDVEPYLGTWFTYAVNFKAESLTHAKMVGVGSIFGASSRPTAFTLSDCELPRSFDSNLDSNFQSAAQLFLNNPSDRNVPTTQGVLYNGFGKAFTAPNIKDVVECASPAGDAKHYFRVQVALQGPHTSQPYNRVAYTTWYSMSSETQYKGQSNERELISGWGPDPLGGAS